MTHLICRPAGARERLRREPRHSVGKPHFYWVSEGLLQSSHGRGFRACGTILGNHAGESRVSSSAVNSRRIQNVVHNSGVMVAFATVPAFSQVNLNGQNNTNWKVWDGEPATKSFWDINK